MAGFALTFCEVSTNETFLDRPPRLAHRMGRREPRRTHRSSRRAEARPQSHRGVDWRQGFRRVLLRAGGPEAVLLSPVQRARDDRDTRRSTTRTGTSTGSISGARLRRAAPRKPLAAATTRRKRSCPKGGLCLRSLMRPRAARIQATCVRNSTSWGQTENPSGAQSRPTDSAGTTRRG